MNTNTNALETYTAELAAVDAARAEFDKVPLVKHRQALSTATQRLADESQVEDHRATVFGGAIHNAGMKFLETIHADIRANEPQWKKDLRDREEELERIATEKAACKEVNSMSAE
jgi:hypothetical protein